MATVYHLTPEGPRRCSVDSSKPNSRGCPLGGTHFDSFEDAMEVYTEDLKKTFGDFHVLVRASAKERLRRLGYRSLEGIERTKADARVQSTVRALKVVGSKAREAAQEIRNGQEPKADGERASSLPETVATEPLIEATEEDRQSEELTKELFSSGEPETMESFGARMMADSSKTSFRMAPLDRTELDAALAVIDSRETIRKTPYPGRPSRFSAYRSARKRKVALAKDQLRSSWSSGSASAKKKLTDAGYAVRASASVARDTAELRTRVAAARLQDSAVDIGKAAQRRAALMSVPAGHIRPGDTFDGTTVRSVELVGEGKVKISYQAKPGGPVLAATVAGDRSMRVDRKTRRESRNSRISSKMAKPIAQTRALSERVARASESQLALFGNLGSRDSRLGAIDRSILQHERSLRQRELIDQLKGLRSSSRNRVLQDS